MNRDQQIQENQAGAHKKVEGEVTMIRNQGNLVVRQQVKNWPVHLRRTARLRRAVYLRRKKDTSEHCRNNNSIDDRFDSLISILLIGEKFFTGL
jgi:hypothetical protein